MSRRSEERRITPESRVLRFLREQTGLSYREAAKRSGVNLATINHLENGRIAIHERHLQKLLPHYGATRTTFEMFVRGSVSVPENLRHECFEAIKALSNDQLRSVLPVLRAMAPVKG